ncbi:MAG: type II secretion system protein [Thermosynechococcaceae cyanobacterium]
MRVTRFKILALTAKRHHQHSGFTLIEVLVGMLLVLIFAAVSMQAFLAATAIKIRAQELSEADTWIKADLEDLRKTAKNLDLAGTEYTPSLTTCLGDFLKNGGSANRFEGYGYKLLDQISASLRNPTTGIVPLNADVAPVDGTNDSVKITTVRTSEVGNRPYNLDRTLTPVNASPYNRLAVTYRVTAQSDGDTVATLYTEILPDASFVCPAQPS